MFTCTDVLRHIVVTINTLLVCQYSDGIGRSSDARSSYISSNLS